MSWRWDQGRLDYFRVQNIRSIATVLAQFDGEVIGGRFTPDILRGPLHVGTGLSFPPEDDPKYKIWRNFGRVFGQLMLATKIDQRLRISEVCSSLANGQHGITDEQFLQFWIRRYTSPSPSFEDYSSGEPPVFPFCAVIKLALARLPLRSGSVEARDVVDLLIGNKVTGEETLRFYRELRPSGLVLPGERLRQIREMIAVLGQVPFLKWESSSLSIDRSSLPSTFEVDIMAYASPDTRLARLDKEHEILQQGSLRNAELTILELPETSVEEEDFLEGSRRRVTHLRIERSGKLRQLYMERSQNPDLCNMCSMITNDNYPWAKNLIEVHHLLPLGSLLRVETKTTSLNDVVGVCPSCHRATHQFYKLWLRAQGAEDFRSNQEARDIYYEAKTKIRGFSWDNHA